MLKNNIYFFYLFCLTGFSIFAQDLVIEKHHSIGDIEDTYASEGYVSVILHSSLNGLKIRKIICNDVHEHRHKLTEYSISKKNVLKEFRCKAGFFSIDFDFMGQRKIENISISDEGKIYSVEMLLNSLDNLIEVGEPKQVTKQKVEITVNPKISVFDSFSLEYNDISVKMKNRDGLFNGVITPNDEKFFYKIKTLISDNTLVKQCIGHMDKTGPQVQNLKAIINCAKMTFNCKATDPSGGITVYLETSSLLPKNKKLNRDNNKQNSYYLSFETNIEDLINYKLRAYDKWENETICNSDDFVIDGKDDNEPLVQAPNFFWSGDTLFCKTMIQDEEGCLDSNSVFMKFDNDSISYEYARQETFIFFIGTYSKDSISFLIGSQDYSKNIGYYPKDCQYQVVQIDRKKPQIEIYPFEVRKRNDREKAIIIKGKVSDNNQQIKANIYHDFQYDISFVISGKDTIYEREVTVDSSQKSLIYKLDASDSWNNKSTKKDTIFLDWEKPEIDTQSAACKRINNDMVLFNIVIKDSSELIEKKLFYFFAEKEHSIDLQKESDSLYSAKFKYAGGKLKYWISAVDSFHNTQSTKLDTIKIETKKWEKFYWPIIATVALLVTGTAAIHTARKTAVELPYPPLPPQDPIKSMIENEMFPQFHHNQWQQ